MLFQESQADGKRHSTSLGVRNGVENWRRAGRNTPRRSQGRRQAQKYRDWRRKEKEAEEEATQAGRMTGEAIPSRGKQNERTASTLNERKEVNESQVPEWRRKVKEAAEKATQAERRLREAIASTEKRYGRTSSTLNGRKEEKESIGSRTRSTSTWEKEKVTREQGTQTEDIRKGTRGFRPDEISPPTSKKQRVRPKNGWKKKQEENSRKQEENSRKMNEMNIEGRLSDTKDWRPTPVLDFLIDTGASKSFISDRYYKQHLRDVKLTPHYVNISAVNGNRMNVLGKCRLTMELHGKKIQHPFIVTNVKEDAILGFDFLEEHQVRWNWTTKTLEVDKELFPCKMGRMTTKVHRILTHQHSIIPPNSEMIVPGIVIDKKRTGGMGIIEGQQRFLQDYPVAVAAVVTCRRKNSVPVRVINASQKPVVIPKGVGIAMLVPGEVLDAEDIRNMEIHEESRHKEWRKTDGTQQEVRNQLPLELEEMIEATGSLLGEAEKKKFRSLVEQHRNQFMLKDGPIGRTTLVQHEIKTLDKPAIKQRPRREAYGTQPIVREEIEKMLAQDVIEPSTSAWASPIVLVKKKDGTSRFCVDYRCLNEVTIKDAYPLPRIEDNLDALQGACWFSTLDLASGYWQVEVRPEDREKTAFCTKQGLHQFKVMPFGLCNAPGTFERLMESVLRGMQWERAVLYLDDIIIFSKDIDTHMDRIQEVFKRLQDANLKLKPSKCHFFKEQVEFLGHVVSKDGVATDPKKIEAVKEWRTPRNVKEVRSWLGMTGYYRRFMHGYAEIAKPLHDLTRKEEKFMWTKERDTAFVNLKKCLITAPILGYPDSREPFILDTDASGCSIGGVLSQIQDGQERVIAYGSKVLSKEEKNYCVTRRELLAVVYFIKHYRHYLVGKKFLLRTDHGALTWLFKFKEPEGQVARWIESLSSFQFEIQHRPGKLHGNSDGLSRIPCGDSCKKCNPVSHQGKNKDQSEEGLNEKMKEEDNSAEEELSTRKMFSKKKKSEHTRKDQSEEGLIEKVKDDSAEEGLSTRRDQSEEGLTEKVKEDDSAEEGLSTRKPFAKRKKRGRTGRNRRLHLQIRAARDHLEEDATWMGKIKKWQEENEDLCTIRSWTKRPPWRDVTMGSRELKSLWARWRHIRKEDGVLWYLWEKEKQPPIWKMIVPPEGRKDLLYEHHDSKMAGHMGVDRTYERLKASPYYWPAMRETVQEWCGNCDVCATSKPGNKKIHGEMQTCLAGEPMERIAMDIMGPLITSARGNKYVLVVGDYFTKWTEAYPLPDQKAETVAIALIDNFITRFGLPKEIHTDQGRDFESKIVQEMCVLLGIHKTRTTPWHPQSDGMIERFNRTLGAMLRTVVEEHQQDWDSHVSTLCMAYRSSENSTTGYTPNRMMLGRELPMASHLMITTPEVRGRRESTTEFVQNLEKKIQGAHQTARTHIQGKHRQQKSQYDKRAISSMYKVGDLVWLNNPSKKVGRSPKLQTFWEAEPWTITKIFSDVVIKIKKRAKRKQRVVHVDRVQKVRRPEEWNLEEITTPGEVEETTEELPAIYDIDQATGVNPVRRGRSQQPGLQRMGEAARTVQRTTYNAYARSVCTSVRTSVRNANKRRSFQVNNSIVYQPDNGDNRSISGGGECSLRTDPGVPDPGSDERARHKKAARRRTGGQNGHHGRTASQNGRAPPRSGQNAGGPNRPVPAEGGAHTHQRGSAGRQRRSPGDRPDHARHSVRSDPGPDSRGVNPDRRRGAEERREGTTEERREKRPAAECEKYKERTVKSTSLIYRQYQERSGSSNRE